MITKTKVIAYIFRGKSEILVFSHVDFPEAGLQVVGGTVETGEDFPSALSREILEESGLVIAPEELTKIGETVYKRKDREELNHRHYYSITKNDLPDRWKHIVHSEGEDNGLVFEFFWISLVEAITVLDGNFAELLTRDAALQT